MKNHLIICCLLLCLPVIANAQNKGKKQEPHVKYKEIEFVPPVERDEEYAEKEVVLVFPSDLSAFKKGTFQFDDGFETFTVTTYENQAKERWVLFRNDTIFEFPQDRLFKNHLKDNKYKDLLTCADITMEMLAKERNGWKAAAPVKVNPSFTDKISHTGITTLQNAEFVAEFPLYGYNTDLNPTAQWVDLDADPEPELLLSFVDTSWIYHGHGYYLIIDSLEGGHHFTARIPWESMDLCDRMIPEFNATSGLFWLQQNWALETEGQVDACDLMAYRYVDGELVKVALFTYKEPFIDQDPELNTLYYDDTESQPYRQDFDSTEIVSQTKNTLVVRMHHTCHLYPTSNVGEKYKVVHNNRKLDVTYKWDEQSQSFEGNNGFYSDKHIGMLRSMHEHFEELDKKKK